MEKTLEQRMYFFVPYNISPIQQAIQAGHAALEYAYKNSNGALFIHFMDKWKIWVILDGGTTNSRREIGTSISLGSLNQIADSLKENDIDFSYFVEPDLNDALTAVCFIVDERVWNYKDYPDFLNWIFENHLYDEPAQRKIELKMMGMLELTWMFPEYHKEWVGFLGGKKNVFLRELIRGKKLA
jgi:hypothetical protein